MRSTSSAGSSAMAWSDRTPAVEARALRHDFGLTPADPADPFEVAAWRHIDIVHLAVGEKDRVEGAFLRRDRRDFILVNSAKPGRRQRFTCAHELGHAVLVAPGDDAEFVDTDASLDQERGQSVEEREANVFAAELLMPEVGVLKLIEDVASPEDAAGAIARQYNVSPMSAAVRLNELRNLSAAMMDALRATIENDWRTYWRTQNIPHDTKPHADGALPERFRQHADRLLEAGVISPERYAELVERPLHIQS